MKYPVSTSVLQNEMHEWFYPRLGSCKCSFLDLKYACSDNVEHSIKTSRTRAHRLMIAIYLDGPAIPDAPPNISPLHMPRCSAGELSPGSGHHDRNRSRFARERPPGRPHRFRGHRARMPSAAMDVLGTRPDHGHRVEVCDRATVLVIIGLRPSGRIRRLRSGSVCCRFEETS